MIRKSASKITKRINMGTGEEVVSMNTLKYGRIR